MVTVPAPWHKLTKHQREVLELILAGEGYKKIAQQLGVSTKAVRMLASYLLQKLGLRNRTQLIVWYIYWHRNDILHD